MMDLRRWLYRGGRPNRVARVADRLTAALSARGAGPDCLVALEVPGRRSGRPVRLDEVMPALRAPVLKAYLGRAPNARTHVPIDTNASFDQLERVAPRVPVFRVVPRDTA